MDTLERLAKVMLAALAVIVLTWAMADKPYDPAQEIAAQEAAAKSQAPIPGSEAALRKNIDDILAGRRDPREREAMQKLGPLQAVTYLGGGKNGLLPGTGARFDRFLMRFRAGDATAFVLQGGDAKPALAGWGPSGPPTPKQIVEGYASRPAGDRVMRTLTQIGVLLLFALIGRLVFRIRL